LDTFFSVQIYVLLTSESHGKTRNEQNRRFNKSVWTGTSIYVQLYNVSPLDWLLTKFCVYLKWKLIFRCTHVMLLLQENKDGYSIWLENWNNTFEMSLWHFALFWSCKKSGYSCKLFTASVCLLSVCCHQFQMFSA
jgi:hypothetical protein